MGNCARIAAACLAGLIMASCELDRGEEIEAGDETAGSANEAIVSQSIEAIQGRLTEVVMALPGVVGTAIGACGGKTCFKVYVAEMTPDVAEQIPAHFEGFEVEIVRTGEFRALDSTDA